MPVYRGGFFVETGLRVGGPHRPPSPPLTTTPYSTTPLLPLYYPALSQLRPRMPFACESTQRDLMTATRQLVNNRPSLASLGPFSTVRRLFIASGTFAKNTLRISVFHRQFFPNERFLGSSSQMFEPNGQPYVNCNMMVCYILCSTVLQSHLPVLNAVADLLMRRRLGD